MPHAMRQVALGGFAAVRHGGSLLLVRQGYGSKLWGFPGGMVEVGETVGAATQREVLEETGIAIEVDGLLAQWEKPDLCLFVFAATPSGVETVPQDGEIEDAGWFTSHQLRELHPCFSTHRALGLQLLGETATSVLPHSSVENYDGIRITMWAAL